MSRSGYSDECDSEWDLIRWRGAVKSAMRGRRGQAFLKEMLEALDGMSEKRLIADELEAHGEVCALGAVGMRRGVDMTKLDPYDRQTVAATFGVAPALAAEIMYVNDEAVAYWSNEAPEARWQRVRNWVARKILDRTQPGHPPPTS